MGECLPLKVLPHLLGNTAIMNTLIRGHIVGLVCITMS